MSDNKNIVFSAKDAVVRKELSTILSGINIELAENELVALVGSAGSGKTTFGQLVSGDIKAYAGDIEVKPSLKRTFVSQQDNFFSMTGMTLTYYGQRYEYSEENEEIPLVGKWIDKLIDNKEGKEKVFEEMNINPLLERNLMQLSNGERKRTQIALALLNNSDLYVFDQPFLGLDTATREILRKALITLKENGKTDFLICGAKEVPEFSDRVVVIENGSIKDTVETAQYIKGIKAAAEDVPSLDDIDLPLPIDRPEYEFIVKMNDVHVTMQGEMLLSGINWEVRDHERWLLAGHNGSGKSTLLSLITADNPQAYTNDISLFDRKRGSGESIWDIKKKIGFVSPELHLYFLKQTKLSSSSNTVVSDMPCLDVIVSGFNDEIGFTSSITNWQENIVMTWLKELHLDYLKDKNFTEISQGEQRMVLLVRSLIKNPPLLILDEPCQGIDYEQSQRFIKLLDAICTKINSTLIYVSHSPDEIPSCMTHKIELENGTVKSIGKI